MQIEAGRTLSELTTLRVGGRAAEYVKVTTADEIVEAVVDADRSGTPVLVVAGGSNLFVSDTGFDGRVVHIDSRGVSHQAEVDDGVLVDVQAGEPWDSFVLQTIDAGLSGFECLSGIPGSCGATPVQNVGAYGEEIATAFVSLTALDRSSEQVVTLHGDDCAFAYRSSAFKGSHRYVILSVTYRLANSEMSVPVRYGELARSLGIESGERANAKDVRKAVLELRKRKGMVLDAGDPDTRSAGSFFTNPILDPAALAHLGDVPHWLNDDGTVKVSAAWLIEQAGFHKGYAKGRVRLSTKHTLALTNYDDGSASDLRALAAEVQQGVLAKFGVHLHPEPVLVGVEL